MAAAKVLGLIGAVLLVAMLVVGFTPMSVEGVSCGSSFKESSDAAVADVESTLTGGSGPGDLAARCTDKRLDRRPFAYFLGGAAIVVLIAAAAVHDDADLQRAQAEAKSRSTG